MVLLKKIKNTKLQKNKITRYTHTT